MSNQEKGLWFCYGALLTMLIWVLAFGLHVYFQR